MKATGIVRRVDDFGRVVIPEMVRDALGIESGAPMELFVEGDAVLFRKYNPEETADEVFDALNAQDEFDYLLNFIEGNDALDSIEVMRQIRSLWTAFCLHFNINVDTAEYDNRMLDIWNLIQENESAPYSSLEYERFYNAMSKALV